VLAPPVQGGTDIGCFDRGRTMPIGNSDGVSLLAVLMGVRGIAVGLQRQKSVANIYHPPVKRSEIPLKRQRAELTGSPKPQLTRPVTSFCTPHVSAWSPRGNHGAKTPLKRGVNQRRNAITVVRLFREPVWGGTKSILRIEDVMSHGNRRLRRTREDYERGLPGYHDPTAGFGGAAPARSALTLRAVLAAFGLVFCAVAAALVIMAGLTALGVVLAVLAGAALVDLGWVIHRKRRGEPG
jgi:hypothetical protein